MAGPSGSRDVSRSMKAKEMCWIDSKITSMKDLNLYNELVSLNLHCNNITRIEGLESLCNLKHLDLSSNQITVIEGLGGLTSLRTLNLSCNKIKLIEGMEMLKSLCKFDASYNFIDNISGFKDLHGSAYCISHVYLHGNTLSSLDHVINSLVGCIKLKELSFELNGDCNPLCKIPGYRSSIMSALRGLEILDGLNRNGQPATVQDEVHDIPELEEYLDFLLSSSSTETNSTRDVRFDVATPRIDMVLNKFKSHPPLSSDTEEATASTSPSTEPAAFDNPPGKVRLSVDHEVRLEKLENQLANLLYETATVDSKGPAKTARECNSDDSDTEETPPRKEVKFKRTTRTRPAQKRTDESKTVPQRPRSTSRPAKETTSSSTTPTTSPGGGTSGDNKGLKVSGKRVFPVKSIRKPEDDATLLSLIQELDSERERRWKAEQAGRKLLDHIQAMHAKGAEEKKLQEAALAASARLKQALVKERESKSALQNIVAELQARNRDLTDEIQRLKESNEEQRLTLRNMEETAANMETEMIKKHAHEVSKAQEHQMKAAASAREAELFKHTSEQLKGQLQQLQELLASREQEHKDAFQGMVKVDSAQMRDAVDREIAKQEARYEQVIAQYQQRLEKKDAEYVALEDEFRMGLTIEANRFKELQEAFERVSEEAAQYKLSVQTSTQKESKATSMVNELTAMVKEQRVRLTELSKGRQEIVAEYKERIQHLESQLNDARRQLTRLEILEQDKSKLGAQIRAQESVIEGLRTERKLWSQELAQQGASLAQDRGRLESRIEALSAELSQMKKQSQSDNDTIRIKSKMIEDQTDSIRKLKQTVSDLDNEVKQLKDENAKAITNLENQLASESSNNQQLQEEVEVLTERKEELKRELREKQEDLDKTKEGLRSLRGKWQEKSALITQMENEVVKMRDSFKEKEKALIDERDKAVTAGK
ncbi:leucine-rich repeat and coiled-coil domain-containing protein 1-like [Actinia tenebrosa]|uniref:Leucine-rich repeat and coiled-coil domain-containing protein 1 n=1 Tax=Actinia tenebrosa TaxID=6105 RepID=A0A6P8IQI4_ACTTE|nr:leucine-rich repeat and coiled-coil domain-containing protein 1-like [Actinia tenebrosa]